MNLALGNLCLLPKAMVIHGFHKHPYTDDAQMYSFNPTFCPIVYSLNFQFPPENFYQIIH